MCGNVFADAQSSEVSIHVHRSSLLYRYKNRHSYSKVPQTPVHNLKAKTEAPSYTPFDLGVDFARWYENVETGRQRVFGTDSRTLMIPDWIRFLVWTTVNLRESGLQMPKSTVRRSLNCSSRG